MKNLIILDKDDLRELLHEIISGIISLPKENEKPFLSIKEAIEYLNSKGVIITKSTLYKHTMNGTIPFSRFGERKIVFTRENLDEWVSERITNK